jgi:hypothetical protein
MTNYTQKYITYVASAKLEQSLLNSIGAISNDFRQPRYVLRLLGFELRFR